jgi:hypothetical protein
MSRSIQELLLSAPVFTSAIFVSLPEPFMLSEISHQSRLAASPGDLLPATLPDGVETIGFGRMTILSEFFSFINVVDSTRPSQVDVLANDSQITIDDLVITPVASKRNSSETTSSISTWPSLGAGNLAMILGIRLFVVSRHSRKVRRQYIQVPNKRTEYF